MYSILGDFLGVAHFIGHYIMMEEDTFMDNDTRMFDILVDVDMVDDLLEEIEVTWTEGSFI